MKKEGNKILNNGALANLMKDAKKEKHGYKIGGKEVSEYRFFKTIADEISGKKKRKVFYWTDKKVMLLLKCLDIKISQEAMNDFKKQCDGIV